MSTSIYDFTLPAIDGSAMPLSTFQGKVLLIVNVASQCGLTPQYKGLEALYQKYKEKGLVVLGFPANNFGAQEPGTNEQIQSFCDLHYRVTFPLYAKVSVKGEDQTPLYQYLTMQASPTDKRDIEWNFTKFLVGRDGKVVNRFEPGVVPEDPQIVSAINGLVS